MRYIPFALALTISTLVACGDKDAEDTAVEEEATEEASEEATEEEEAEDTGSEE